MAVVNTTPDSFYSGSRVPERELAVARGLAAFDLGADVVDVGGESTRPGADVVSEAEELDRVIPVIEALAAHGPVSVDTQKEAVARAAVAAGATIINDVSASLAAVASELGVGYVAMHRQGTSATMQNDPRYDDVVAEVHGFLTDPTAAWFAGGITPLWLDPGIGFGKTVAHNLSLIRHVDDLVRRASECGAGVLLGTSRKRFLSDLGREHLEAEDRLEGTIATLAWAAAHGVAMVRVHDVAAAVRVRELASADGGRRA